MKKLRKMFDLACKELGWNPKDWITDGQWVTDGDNGNQLEAGGVVFEKIGDDKYSVTLYEVGSRGVPKAVASEEIDGANFAVVYGMKHIVEHYLTEGLPLPEHLEIGDDEYPEYDKDAETPGKQFVG